MPYALGAWSCGCRSIELIGKRLRKPAGKLRFKRTVALLAKPGTLLPVDRHERKLVLAEYLKDGSVEGLGTRHALPPGPAQAARPQ